MIGVMVASVIGLIIATGITQLFIQMSSRLTQQENRFKRQLFYSFLKRNIENTSACKNTLNGINLRDPDDDDRRVAQLKNASNVTLYDFYNATDRAGLENDFGIKKDAVFLLTLGPTQTTTSTSANLTLTLVTQDNLHNKIPVYNKAITLTLNAQTQWSGTSIHIQNCL